MMLKLKSEKECRLSVFFYTLLNPGPKLIIQQKKKNQGPKFS